MFCKNCGTQMPDDAAFCPKCGTAMREGKQTAKQPEGSGETGKGASEKILQEVSKPRKPVKKADKRKVLIGAGAGIGIVCVIILLLSVFKSDFLYQYNDDGTARLVRYNGNGSSVTIPSEVKHGSETYSVTSIGRIAFGGCISSLTSITIPDSVTSIDWYAFQDSSSLTNITIPDSVTGIGDGAFTGCSSLTSITIPDSVTSINRYAFQYCSSLTSIKIPGSVTSIGDGAFRECSSLTSITIPDSVTSIGDGVFSGCSSLTSITIPDGVTSIGDGVFSGCSSLTDVTIGSGVTRIGYGAFKECSSLTSITIAGVNVTVLNIDSGRWKDMVGKSPENSNGYNRSDFVSEKAYQNYLDFGDTSGLKK